MPSHVPVKVLSGHCPIDELPDQLDLSELADAMERLWNKSVADLDEGIVMEHAATIVMQIEGSLKLVNEVAGMPNFVVPNFIVTASQTFIGTFHTHPRLDGLLPMPFSGTDFVSAIQLHERLSTLYSDQIVFALVHTAMTADHVDSFTVRSEFGSFLRGVNEQSPLFLDAVWKSNKWLAERYGFGLYMGIPSMLTREV